MKLPVRASALGKKITLITTAFVLAVSSLTAAVPFVLAKNASAATIHSTTLAGWDFSSNKSGGHQELVANGLRVWTTGGSSDGSNRKAAGYRAVAPFALAQASDADIQFASFSGPRPSLQLGVDIDGDGDWDGYLVYEPWAYGEGNFWTSKNFGLPTGQGYEDFGTIADFASVNPNAKVIAIGYSLGTLGNHPDGDSVISKLTVGGNDYTFAAVPPATPGNLRLNGTELCGYATNVNFITPTWDAVPGATSYNYKVTLPGGAVYGPTNVGNVTSVSGAFGAQGTSTFSVQAVAANGLTSDWATPCAVSYDVTAPTGIDDLAGVIGGTVTVTQHIEDNIAPESGKLRVWKLTAGGAQDNTKFFAIGDLSANSNGDVVYTLDTLANLYGDGKYIAKFTATDAAGNATVSSQKTFVVDNTAPTLTVKPESVGDTASKVFSNVSFKLYDANKVDKIAVNGQVKELTDSVWSDANFVNIKQYLTQGANSVVLYDVAGNSTAYDFTYDAVKPTVTVKASPDTIGASPYQKVSFKLYDQYKVARAEVNGSAIELSDSPWSDLNNLVPGGSMHGVAGANIVKVWDVAGNVTEVNFVLDVTAPNASFLFSNNNGNAVTNQDVTVTMNTTEPIQTPVDWNKVSDTQFTRVYSANGKFNVAITDLAGNAATKNYEVKRIDKQAPVVIASGANGLAGFRGDVNVTVTDQNFSKLYVNGAQVSAPSAGGWDYVLANALSGNGTYAIKATDKGGNETNLTVVIDNSLFSTLNVSAFDIDTPTVSGVLTYTADSAPVADTDIVVTVDTDTYYTTTNAAGEWTTPVLVGEGEHQVSVGVVNDDSTSTTIATSLFTTTFPAPEVPEEEEPTTPTTPTTPVDGGEAPTEEGDGAPVPATTPFTAPAAINPSAFAGVLGTGSTGNAETNTGDTDGEAVEGASTEDILAQAVDANNTDGNALGLAWYWWLLIIAGGATGIWWLIAALRGRSAE